MQIFWKYSAVLGASLLAVYLVQLLIIVFGQGTVSLKILADAAGLWIVFLLIGVMYAGLPLLALSMMLSRLPINKTWLLAGGVIAGYATGAVIAIRAGA